MLNHKKQPFIVIGISGGVDSAVVASILKNKNCHIEAVFMKNWQEIEGSNCNSEYDLEDAKKVCDFLKIKLHIVDFTVKYKEKVFQYFLHEYAIGNTPNPDILCNKEIKFNIFLDYAKNFLGANFIATGHYVRKRLENNKYTLLKGFDKKKDQSYFLHLLNQEQLAFSIFPIGNLTKTIVRKIAKEIKLPNYNKKDSMGICFIGKRNFRLFLSTYFLKRPGNIVTLDNNIIGKHLGLMFYTIGQRKGIGIGGNKNYKEIPWYVVDKDIKNNLLFVTQDKEHPRLMARKLFCSNIHWISQNIPSKFPFFCFAKIRHQQIDQECIINTVENNTKFEITFSRPQWAITPGQSIVFYSGNICLGGAIISCVIDK